jgi:hypothetical protein
MQNLEKYFSLVETLLRSALPSRNLLNIIAPQVTSGFLLKPLTTISSAQFSRALP